MKITKIIPVNYEVIKTDIRYQEFHRYPDGKWTQIICGMEQNEIVILKPVLEIKYQEFKNGKN